MRAERAQVAPSKVPFEKIKRRNPHLEGENSHYEDDELDKGKATPNHILGTFRWNCTEICNAVDTILYKMRYQTKYCEQGCWNTAAHKRPIEMCIWRPTFDNSEVGSAWRARKCTGCLVMVRQSTMHTFETWSPPRWRLYEGATSSASVRKIDTRSGGLIGLIGCTALNWRFFEAIRESAHAKPRPLPLDMEVVNISRHRYRINGSITQHHHDLDACRMRTIRAKTPQNLPLSTQYNFLVRI